MYTGLILDAILAALVVMVAFVSAKKGFLLLILDIAASIAAFIGARFACAPVAEYLYTNYIQSAVLAKTQEYVGDGASAVNSVIETVNSVLAGISPSLDGLIKNLGVFPAITEEQTGMSAQTLESGYLAPVITGLLSAVAMVVIAILLLIVLRIVALLLNKLIVRKPLKKINETLGWILGFIKGLIPVFIIACIFVMIAPVLDVPKLSELTDTSYICKLALLMLEKVSLI